MANNDLFNLLLKGGLDALQKSQGQPGQGGSTALAANGPAPRFEEGVSPNTYLNAFNSSFRGRNPRALESPFRGLGLVVSDNLQPVLLNSSATFFGLNEWNVVDTSSSNPRMLSGAEVQQIRAELLSRLRWDLLVGPVWGQGAPRKALVLSAPDCPYCIQMELDLANGTRSPAYELYYLPIMLNKTSKVASQIWCANNRVEGWQQAMLKRSIGNPGNCGKEELADAVSLALGLATARPDGKIARGTPTLLLDSGELGNWSRVKPKVMA
jgi:hypothetical protein